MRENTMKYRVAQALVRGAGDFTAQECRDNDFYLYYGILQSMGSSITRDQIEWLQINTDDPSGTYRMRRHIQNTLALYPASPEVQKERRVGEQKWHDEFARNPAKYSAEKEEIIKQFGRGDGKLL